MHYLLAILFIVCYKHNYNLQIKYTQLPSGSIFLYHLTSVLSIFTIAVILATTPCWLWSARIHNAIATAMSICVAFGNKVIDTRDWHILWGVPPKYDVSTLVVILARCSNIFLVRKG